MKYEMQQTKSKQQGMTLIEGLAFLGIFAVVIGGALMMFGSADSSQKSTQHISELTALRTAMKQLYQGQGSYGTVNVNNTLNTAKKIPSTIAVNTATTPVTLSTAWNGAISVAGATTTFTVTSTLVPQDVCVQVVAGASNNGWTALSVGGTAVTLPATPAAAATACSGATNTVVLTSN